MKKLNKKGFILIELLAVVVILLAISVIAVSSISAAIERNKVKQNAAKQEVLISYAKLYYDQYKNTLSNNGYIKLNKLVDAGLATEEELYDVDGNLFSGCINYNLGNFKYVTNGCPS